MGSMTKWRKEKSAQAAPSTVAASPPKAIVPIRMQVEKVRPEDAIRWLAENPSNRPISEEQVKRYAADMKRGDWKQTHQGIAFDRSGALLDGQHRLRAIVRARVTLSLVVFRDCDRDSFDRLDVGKKRTAADALSIDGVESARAVAAIARSVIVFGFKDSSVTDSFVVEFARENSDELQEYVPLVSTLTAPAAAAFMFASTDPKLRPAVQVLMANRDGQEMEDLQRCIRVMSSHTGHASQRARYAMAMDTIVRAEGRKR
jgi:hypothetical protein